MGAGAAGRISAPLIQARPDWRIAIFERSNRIGGRLWSVKVDGLAHPIELGGMRYMSGHRLVQSVVDELGIETRAFDPAEQPERTFLRGVVGRSPDDPDGGRAYDLPAGEAGRSAADLMRDAFLGSCRRHASSTRPAGVDTGRRRRSAGGRSRIGRSTRPSRRSSVPRAIASRPMPSATTPASSPHNAGDAIQYVMGTGYPSGKARVPVDGMDRIPRELAAHFEALGGTVWLGHDVRRVEAGDRERRSGLRRRLRHTRNRLVLTLPIPALEALAGASPLINGPTWQRLYRSIEGFSGTKLYCWYERPWWRDGADPPTGLRTTTDLPNRKIFYFDEAPDDRRRSSPPSPTTGTTSRSSPWPTAGVGEHRPPAALLEALRGWLAAAHPGADVPALPAGSAFQHWGADPREVAWHFWRAGANSDEIMDLAAQPDPSLPIHLCGEVFSRRGAWVEGAMEAATTVADRLLGTAT